jgi:hypothetical protein
MKEIQHWKGPITFTKKEHKKEFSALHWLAQAASTDDTRFFMSGIYNEFINGHRVFVATDGRRLHKVVFPGDPAVFAGIPEGKNISVKADSKQVVFTEEIDADFPGYKKVIPDITGIAPFRIFVRKDTDIGYTEAFYDLYTRGIKMNALHVQGLDRTGCPEWSVYHTGGSAVVCIQEILGTVYTMVAAVLRE